MDTPGIHTPKNKLGEYMVKTAYEANRDVDLTLLLLDAKMGIGQRDREILERLGKKRLIAVINKIDAVSAEKVELMQKELFALQLPAEQIKEISAAQGTGIEALEQEIVSYLYPGRSFYPEDMVTDRRSVLLQQN